MLERFGLHPERAGEKHKYKGVVRAGGSCDEARKKGLRLVAGVMINVGCVFAAAESGHQAEAEETQTRHTVSSLGFSHTRALTE